MYTALHNYTLSKDIQLQLEYKYILILVSVTNLVTLRLSRSNPKFAPEYVSVTNLVTLKREKASVSTLVFETS